MLAYIGKRLLLMIPTLIGVLTLTFVVIQFVPGGPVEQILAEARAGTGGETGGFSGKRDLDQKQIEELKRPRLRQAAAGALPVDDEEPRSSTSAGASCATRTSGS